MPTKEEMEEEIKAKYDEMQAKNTYTPIAFERSIKIYDQIGDILKQYTGNLGHPTLGQSYQLKMEQEILFLLAAELDKNFFEGVMDSAIKHMTNIMKTPQIKELSKTTLKNAFAQAGGKEDLLKKILGDKLTNLFPEEVNQTTTSNTNNIFELSSRNNKKEDLN